MRTHENASVLVVDDEVDLVDIVCEALAPLKVKVQKAYDGRTALEICRKSQLDLIISDINMPEMSGVDLLKAVKQIDPLMPVVFITAFANKDLVRSAWVNDAFDFIEKPLNLEKLRDVASIAMVAGRGYYRLQNLKGKEVGRRTVELTLSEELLSAVEQKCAAQKTTVEQVIEYLLAKYIVPDLSRNRKE